MNMQQTFEKLFAVEDLDHLDPQAAIDHLGMLIDASLDTDRIDASEKAIQLAEKLRSRPLTSQQSCLLHYFEANAWANVGLLSEKDAAGVWAWERTDFENQIIHLRQAIQEEGFLTLHPVRRAQIYTNLGNLLSTVGRFIEAQEQWNAALALHPAFAMAIGNRGRGRLGYAQALYDSGHHHVFLRHALVDLNASLNAPHDDPLGPDPDAREAFQGHRDSLKKYLPEKLQRKGTKMEDFSLGKSQPEVRYRTWGLAHCLFLNPLNDLGPYSIAAHDVLTTPDIVVGVGEGPYYQGFFNQLKQEYASARWLYYDGITSTKPHFSDRDVLLFNTLDYPSYSLSVEKTKAAFRIAYSLLDKVAFYLNDYLKLGIPERRVYFKSIWFKKQDRAAGLRDEFAAYANWPLRGLFWLSKDMFEDKEGFRKGLEPDARELDAIRNYAEHKYLKLHDDLWHGPEKGDDQSRRFLSDTLAASFYRSDFEAKALRLLKTARSALIYLSLGIHAEELHRKQKLPADGIVMPMYLDTWDDEWKA